ncbi:thiamine pyrophosphate-binding protein [Paenibacillus sp. MCAF9]|uniref:thiamine pyrophosphate-binding protein n=1 Tax=unclassified Paenibacillus TaxID=185978 RepID=UPI003F96E42E
MKLSDYVIDFVKQQGVSHVFEFIGGAIAHLLDSVAKRDDMECISVRHEQAGAFAAEAYARLNGKLGVAMATSGPGALNLVTGIGSCYFDSVPCLFITGQVNTYEYKFDKPVRQIGFQETDIVSVVDSLTKYSEMVIDPKKIRFHLEKAVFIAQTGRPGPVLLDIPMNLQRDNIEPDHLESFYDSQEYFEMIKEQQTAVVDDNQLNNVLSLISQSKRPVVLVGGGIRIAGAQDSLRQFINKTGIPVVSSLMGLDSIPHTHESFFGLIGSYGNRYSNLTLANCDLLIILGSRLDTRQTGTRPDTFGRAAIKIHVDIDALELNAKVAVDVAIHSNVKDFLVKLNEKIENNYSLDLQDWYQVINNYRKKYPTRGKVNPGQIDPNEFIEELSVLSNEGDVICLDVGQHQMWASQSFKIKENQRLLNSGGMGAMGFALPAAIGAALSTGQRAIVIAGDGGIQLNIQELDTIVRYGLPIKIFVMNNNCLGMVRQFQDLYFEGRKQSTVYTAPRLNDIAMAYDVPAYNITNSREVTDVLKQVLESEGPSFVNVTLIQDTAVNPKLVVNRPIEDMSPHLERKELKDIMLIDLVEEMEVPK